MNIDKMYLYSEIETDDRRFRLFFKPMSLSLGEPEKPGLYLLRMHGSEKEILLFSPCGLALNWHDAECDILSRVDELDLDDSDKEMVREFIWNEIVGKTREAFEE